MSSFARVERLAARMEPPQKERATVVGEELDQLSREGARRMLMQALDWEVADYIERDEDARDEGHALVVRNDVGLERAYR